MNFENPSDDALRDLLRRVKNIAVVGLSPKAGRPSYTVSRAMQGFGYRIVPVRPAVEEVLGEKAYPRLADVPFPVDLVNVFRAAEHIDAVVDECLALKVPAIWIQEGIINEAAAQRAREAGLTVVMDRCVYKNYLRLLVN
ncbi:MAG: CoA-binding protein [Sulfuricellaceae bacterium]|nr:CoA-binding protein [Sulfuricellaceae bacterium]